MYLGVLAGCSEAPIEAEFLVETRHFDVIVHPGARVPCSGEFEHIDEFVELVRPEVDYAGPRGRTSVHIWPREAADVPCEVWAEGCFSSSTNEIHVRNPTALVHEVAHAAITTGLSPFYSEGWATALSTSSYPAAFVPFDPRPLLSQPNTQFEYAQAAAFVSFVIDTFGASTAYHAMLDASEGSDTAFVEWTGQDLDSIVASFMVQERICSPIIARCADTPEPVGASWELMASVACAALDTLGNDGGEHLIRTVELTTAGLYRIEVEYGGVVLESCTPCAQRSDVRLISLDGPEDKLVMLDAGRHALTLTSDRGSSTRVRLTRQD